MTTLSKLSRNVNSGQRTELPFAVPFAFVSLATNSTSP